MELDNTRRLLGERMPLPRLTLYLEMLKKSGSGPLCGSDPKLWVISQPDPKFHGNSCCSYCESCWQPHKPTIKHNWNTRMEHICPTFPSVIFSAYPLKGHGIHPRQITNQNQSTCLCGRKPEETRVEYSNSTQKDIGRETSCCESVLKFKCIFLGPLPILPPSFVKICPVVSR